MATFGSLDFHNKIILDTMKERFESTDKPTFVDIICCDFDGVKFHLFTPDESNLAVVNLSLSWSVFPVLMKGGGKAKMQKEYGSFVTATESGYDVTLQIDASKVTPEQKARLPFHLSMLKRNVFAAPFADFFDACKKKADLPTLTVPYRTNEAIFLKTEQERCIVIFNMSFVDPDDQLLGKVFIEEFVYARKSLPASPSCSFSLVEPPRELEGVAGVTSQENQGFVSFVLHPAHQNKRANTISQIQIFRNYLMYHIKCTKAFMHTRMRSRVRTLLQVLNRAKVEPFTKSAKKTVSGKTFKRR